MDEIRDLKKQVKFLRLGLICISAVLASGLAVSIFMQTASRANAQIGPQLPPEETDNTVIPLSTFNFPVYGAPESLDFCGEQVPLQEFEVRERYDFELLVTVYKNSATILGYKRAHRWFPVIEPILKKNGIPDDFKYLSVIESNLANVISPSNAVGFWQFLAATGKQFGLEVNEEVDERYNVAKSTEAACLYLKQAYAKFGSWTLAAASYNMGMTGLAEQVASQKVSGYYDLKLNSETSRYVLRLVCTKEMFLNPEKYGYSLNNGDLYPVIPTRTKEVKGPVESWIEFARENGTNYKLLRELNPWIRKEKLTNHQRKTYEILLPAEGYDRYDDLLKKKD